MNKINYIVNAVGVHGNRTHSHSCRTKQAAKAMEYGLGKRGYLVSLEREEKHILEVQK
jgi:hypothetical protein